MKDEWLAQQKGYNLYNLEQKFIREFRQKFVEPEPEIKTHPCGCIYEKDIETGIWYRVSVCAVHGRRNEKIIR